MLKADKDVIACPYPMKMMDWDKIWRRLIIKKMLLLLQICKSRFYTYPIKVEDITL